MVTYNEHEMMTRCWFDGGPASFHHHITFSCQLGYSLQKHNSQFRGISLWLCPAALHVIKGWYVDPCHIGCIIRPTSPFFCLEIIWKVICCIACVVSGTLYMYYSGMLVDYQFNHGELMGTFDIQFNN